MVDAFYVDNNRIQVIKSDDISFDSDRPSIQLLPESSKLSISRIVTFPNLLSAPAYLQRTYSGGGTSYCESWSALLPQEWGPDEVDASPPLSGSDMVALITRNLPEEYIGEVPAGTDYIDVRAYMTRIVAPPVFMQDAPPRVMFQEGAWIGLPGGSCPCEYFQPLARHFDIQLRGTSLYLRRFQSVENAGRTRIAWGTSPGSQYGWFNTIATPWAPYSGAPANYGTPAHLIQSRTGGATENLRAPWAPNSNSSCSVATVDYSSVYSCQFEIHPGRYKSS